MHETILRRQGSGRASSRTYGVVAAALKAVFPPLAINIPPVAAMMLLIAAAMGSAHAEPVRIVAFGDSLTAGYELPASAAFPVRLEAALRERGHEVEIANAGVSGDTAGAGLQRLDWAIPEGTDGVILELGANDALRGIDPALTRDALATIVARLRERGIEVLIAGMLAPPNLGPAYGEAFAAIYADLASEHDALLYPFFLEGVATDPALNLDDGLHPNAAGIDIIVANILPSVEALIARIQEGRGEG